MQVKQPPNRGLSMREAAYHEAAHAVIAIELGVEVIRATLKIKSGVIDGWVRHARTPVKHRYVEVSPDCFDLRPARRSELHASRKEAIIAYSGFHAECRLGVAEKRAALHADGDAAQILQISRGAFGSVNNRWLDKCWLRSFHLVAAQWEPIKAVAEALLEDRTLDGAHVKRIADRMRVKSRLAQVTA